MKTKRNLFAEVSEGLDALAEEREGKRTLRTHAVTAKPIKTISPEELIRIRARFNMSRAVFATYLSINPRTLENWEQGRAEPNKQALVLLRMLDKYPDTLQRITAI